MTLKDQSFVNKVKVSFVCIHEDVHVTFKSWIMLKSVSEVTLLTKNIFSLKFLNFVQSFVECKVSLADGMSLPTHHQYSPYLLIKLKEIIPRIRKQWISPSQNPKNLKNCSFVHCFKYALHLHDQTAP
jgi:hypothetical protein